MWNEDGYLDILQNIEFAIVATYREMPEICDGNVMRALEAVAEHYRAELARREPRPANLSVEERALVDGMREICDWRLGRLTPSEGAAALGEAPDPVPVDVILRCLKQIQKSVKRWNKRYGERGYLELVDQFIL